MSRSEELLGAGGEPPRNAPPAADEPVATGRPARVVGPLVVAVAIVVVLARVAPDPTVRVVGSPAVDGYGTQWFFWFAGEVLAGRQAAGWTDLFFFPWGKDVYAHTGGNLLDAWLAWPLRVVFGSVLGFTLWIAALLATNAWAGTRLAAALGVRGAWRWAAGLALVLNPYVLGEIDLGRPTQAWLAPAGVALAGLVTMRRARDAVAAGAWLAVTALAYWYYGMLLGALAVVVGLARIATGPERVRALGTNVLAAAVCGALTLPFALPMLDALDGGAVPGLLALDGDGILAPLALRTVEGDEQGLYVVAPLSGAAGSLVDDGGLAFRAGLPGFLPWEIVGALVGVGVLAATRRGALRGGAPPRPKSPILWIPVGLVGALLVASGPAFVVGEGLHPNRVYLALVESLDVLRRWWWPGRAVFLVHLIAAPLVAVALAALPRGRALVAIGLVVATAIPLRREALLPVASWDAAVPETLSCLARAPAGAVIDVPLLVDQKNLWFQTVHGKPILGGMLLKKAAFAPPAFATLRGEDPLVRALEAIGERQPLRDVAPATDAERAALRDLGYRYVLARVDAFARPRTVGGGVEWVSEWSRPRRHLLALLGAPAAEDAALALWTLDGGPLDCGQKQ